MFAAMKNSYSGAAAAMSTGRAQPSALRSR
jgi:hypothetical protein